MRRRGIVFLLVFAFVLACSGDDGGGGDDAGPTSPTAPELVRLNDVQVLGSHNSYHVAPEDAVLDALAGFSSELVAEIDYSHRSLTEQLETFGIRQVELDVFADPEGGRFATRPALALVGFPVESDEPALDEPGFKPSTGSTSTSARRVRRWSPAWARSRRGRTRTRTTRRS